MKFVKAWESAYLLPLHAEHNFLATQNELFRFFGISHKRSIIIGNGKAVETFYAEEDLEEQGKHGLSVFSDRKNVMEILEISKKLFEKG